MKAIRIVRTLFFSTTEVYNDMGKYKRNAHVKHVPDSGANHKRAVSAFIHFIEYHPPARLSRNLRRMLLELLLTEGGGDGLYFNDLLYDLDGLFELLDEVELERSS